MIFPGNWHADYEPNIEALEKQGYRRATQDELPQNLRTLCGGPTFMINDEGTLKTVSHSTGEIGDMPVPQKQPQQQPQARAFRM